MLPLPSVFVVLALAQPPELVVPAIDPAPIARILAGVDSKRAFSTLVELCDDIGHRLSGSPQLEKAVAWGVARLKADGHENVRAEPVQVPKWVRGKESLTLISPREVSLTMLGLGGSIGTPEKGITAEVIVAVDEADLERQASAIKGKIVLFNNPMAAYHPEKGPGYGDAVRFRAIGPGLAAKHGAVAVLVRSVTAHSLATPHTGGTSTREGPPPIPAAAVTVEDAELLARFAARGKKPTVTLRMEARSEGMAPSANVVAELRGRELPSEIVIISGHLDSWDVGQGAHDDGSGVVMAMEALGTLRRLGLQPRRTIRVVLWTNEENGLAGARQYVLDHATELPDHVAAIEADTGCYAPIGYRVEAKDPAVTLKATAQLDELLRHLAPVGATHAEPGFSGSDIMPLKEHGVLLLGHHMDLSTYFDIHHTPADTVDKIQPEVLAQNVAALAATAWILAEVPVRLGALQ